MTTHVWFVEFFYANGNWQPFDWFPARRLARKFIVNDIATHKTERARYRIRKYVPED